jgi:phosphotransferase system HPr (HPr) family protein
VFRALGTRTRPASPDPTVMNAQRPKILFINSKLDRHDGSLPVVRALEVDYDVDEKIELIWAAVELVRLAEKSGRPYDAIITHLPPGSIWPGGYPYGQSLGIISDMAQSTEAPIFAYTAAAHSDVKPFSFCVEEIVGKGQVEDDIVKLRELLARTVGRPRRHPVAVDSPRVIHREGRTEIKATVNLHRGIHSGVVPSIIKLCKDFEGDVMLRKTDGEESDEEANAKDLMQLMMLAATEGQRIEISVIGIGPVAETLARRLYAIVTSQFSWNVSLDRFVTPEEKTPTC